MFIGILEGMFQDIETNPDGEYKAFDQIHEFFDGESHICRMLNALYAVTQMVIPKYNEFIHNCETHADSEWHERLTSNYRELLYAFGMFYHNVYCNPMTSSDRRQDCKNLIIFVQSQDHDLTIKTSAIFHFARDEEFDKEVIAKEQKEVSEIQTCISLFNL